MALEAAVVGGGPAGASAALGLRRAGLDVVLFEQQPRWQGRVCGAFINPEGVGHLRRLRVHDALRAAGAVDVPVARLTLASGREGLVAITRGGTPGLAVSRRVLEEVLLQQVRDAGGDVRPGARVVDVTAAGACRTVTVRLAGGSEMRVTASVVVFADGRFSRARTRPDGGRAGWYGWNGTFAGVRQAPGDLSMHFYGDGYVGVQTFGDGETNVCGLVRLGPGPTRPWEDVFQQALASQPALSRTLAGASRLSAWRGVGPLPFGRAPRPQPGLFLAGDAAGVGDPYMGEGISRALASGVLLDAAFAGNAGTGGDRVSRASRVYAAAWAARYRSRLRLGAVIRRLQDHPAWFAAGLSMVLRRPGALHALGRVYHAA